MELNTPPSSGEVKNEWDCSFPLYLPGLSRQNWRDWWFCLFIILKSCVH